MAFKITKEAAFKGLVAGLFTLGGVLIKEAVKNNDNAPSWLKDAFSGESVGITGGSSCSSFGYSGYMDYNTRKDREAQREYEIRKMRMQQDHEERMAKIRATAIDITPEAVDDKKGENNESTTQSDS